MRVVLLLLVIIGNAVASPPSNRDTLTLYDLARLWGVSYTTVYEQARTNHLPVPVFRIGRRYLVSRKAYDDLMSARLEPGQQSA